VKAGGTCSGVLREHLDAKKKRVAVVTAAEAQTRAQPPAATPEKKP